MVTSAPPPNAPARSWWRGFADESVRLFHAYGHWLARMSWWRFLALSVLLLIVSGLLTGLLEVRRSRVLTISHDTAPGSVPAPPVPPLPPVARGDGKDPAIVIQKTRPDGREYSISIGSDGIHITPRRSAPAAPAASTSSGVTAAAPVASGAASNAGDDEEDGDDEAALERSIERTVEAALRGSERAMRNAERARERAERAQERAARVQERIEHWEPPLAQLAMVFILLSAIMKVSYAGTLRAESRAQVAAETAESEQLKRQVVEARMAALQAQVEPHFLFNTLASIDHLIETDPKRASQMQKNLIALLRASMPTLRDGQTKAHTLGREMAVIRPYLEILKVRMEDRLQTRIEVPTGLLSAEFPSMMIQSLVENAIKHGLEPKAEGGELAVSAEIVHGKLAVTVADTGLGFGKAATAGTGVGLENMRERLKLLYGDKAAVVVRDNQPTGTVVVITVPYAAQAPEGSAA